MINYEISKAVGSPVRVDLAGVPIVEHKRSGFLDDCPTVMLGLTGSLPIRETIGKLLIGKTLIDYPEWEWYTSDSMDDQALVAPKVEFKSTDYSLDVDPFGCTFRSQAEKIGKSILGVDARQVSEEGEATIDG